MFKFARLALPVLVLLAVGQMVGCSKKEPVGEEETATLIQPVARVELAGGAAAGAAGGASAPRTGEQVVQQVCGACHNTGAAGAPKTGDKAAWAPRIAQGYEGLLKSATNGKNAMPARGGVADLPDIELARAVVFLANQGGASFKEPAADKTASGTPAADAKAEKTASADGKKTYETVCAACHATGAANAPKAGDKGAWAPRIAQGVEALYKSALNGKNVMPARGGNPALGDAEVKAAVDHMVALAK